jgi:hypothetical protein
MSKTIEESVDHIVNLFDDGFQFKDVIDAIPMAMELVEGIGGLTGQQKQDRVIVILGQLLDKINLPGPDWLTKRAIMWAVPMIIDKLVASAKGHYDF